MQGLVLGDDREIAEDIFNGCNCGDRGRDGMKTDVRRAAQEHSPCGQLSFQKAHR